MMVTDSINVKGKHMFSKLKTFIDSFFESSNHIYILCFADRVSQYIHLSD